MKQIRISELMPLVQAALPDLTDWTVGFVKAVETSVGNFDGVLAGSGVLVTGNGRYAILTADHVCKALPSSGPVGLVLLDRRGVIEHRFLLEMGHVEKISIGVSDESPSGPDLGMLVLPRTEVGKIEARKSFHNLDMRKPRMAAEPGAEKIGPWVMCGLVGELTEAIKSPVGGGTTIAFKGLCGPVLVSRPRQDGQFDYFSAEVNFGPGRGLPEGYGGCSGSGMWRLVLGEGADGFFLEEICLGGIAYYQTAPQGDRRYIECHGIRSVYENSLRALSDTSAR